MQPSPQKNRILTEKEGKETSLSIEEFEKRMGIAFIQRLEFASDSILSKIRRKTEKLYRKGELSRQQLWFGSFYKSEIESPSIPDVIVRYIDPQIGWGVFANRDFKKMEFIAAYTGVLRKSKWSDRRNAYCFEYTLASGVKTRYTIDAQDKGGIARFFNHSKSPNLLSSIATIDFVNYVILIASKPILKGAQLCYDYGPDYWRKREAPSELL